MWQVEMYIGNEWENVWTDTDRVTGKETPSQFETAEEAQAAIDEFFHDIKYDSEVDLDDYDREDYRVVEVINA
ncbi:hypothetical protein [Methylotenera sp.]|uniref:hypothetical protein n=1 Tax=Methylotenera sp. TaxID=2051956 RepID=UPI0024887330|nr:hypothetical protein [Methylotenera sp.]MDI1360647.1 hypothetical protein [Methylotenera sp.]